MFEQYSIWARDVNFFQNLYKRGDIESMLKFSILSENQDNVGLKTSKNFNFLCSPLFSKIQRLISENSYDIIKILLLNKKTITKIKYKIIETILSFGNQIFEIIYKFNLYGKTIKFDKAYFSSNYYNFKTKEKENIQKNNKNFNFNFFSLELLSISKAIFLEFLFLFLNLVPAIFFYIYKWLIFFKKTFENQNIKYKWGIYIISSLLCPKNLKNTYNYKKIQVNPNKIIDFSNDLYDGFLYQKSYHLSEISIFCNLLARKARMNLLYKSIILIKLKTSFGAIFGIDKDNEKYYRISDCFRIEIINNFDCIGEDVKNYLSTFNNRLCYALFEKITFIKNKELDFLNNKKEETCVFNFPLLNKIILQLEKKPKNIYYEIRIIKNNLSIIFFISCIICFFFKIKTNSKIWNNFIREIKYNNFILPNLVSAFFYISVFLKWKKKIGNFKIKTFIGMQLEYILNFFNRTFNSNLFYSSISNIHFLGFTLNKMKKILAIYYIMFGYFKIARCLNVSSGQNFFITEYIKCFALKKNLETSTRRFFDFTKKLNIMKIFKILGKATLNGKYFEILSELDQKLSSEGKYLLGLLLFANEKIISAKKQISISVSMNPKNLKGWFYLGFMAFKSNDFLTSVRAYMKLLNENYLNNCIWVNLSLILFQKFRKKKEAYLSIKQAIKNKSTSFIVLKVYIFYSLYYKPVLIENALEGIKLVLKSKKITDFLKMKVLYQISNIFLEFFLKKKLCNLNLQSKNKEQLISTYRKGKNYINLYFQIQKLYGHIDLYLKDFFLVFYYSFNLIKMKQFMVKSKFYLFNQIYEISNKFYLL